MLKLTKLFLAAVCWMVLSFASAWAQDVGNQKVLIWVL